ncbi:MAG: c-type cytochrome [Candidatus Omnitrophica bacterium]|nr:c-type cytochrome [Candidatus Omnitrophota bacterium]
MSHRFFLILLVGLGSVGLASAVSADRPEPDLTVGRAAYQQQCARCHGVEGKGDGYDAKRLYPRPRDLTEGVFKFRSTATGTAPTDDDLFQALTNGLPGTGMPDWSHLDENLRWQLVEYIKSLSTVFTDAPPEPANLGTDPGRKRIDLAQGKAVYDKLGCAACHGVSGRGNGPSAATLTDNWSRPIRPKDLTERWSYRGGSAPREIVERILTGIDGTAMPSYAEAASPEEVWQLAYYVQSLQQDIQSTMIAHSHRVDGSLPEKADDPQWDEAPRADARLRYVVDAQGAVNAPQTVTRLSFWALHNDEALSLRIRWNDVSEDRPAPTAVGADALAVTWLPQGVAGDVISLHTWPLRGTPPLDLCLWIADETGGSVHEAVVQDFDELLNNSVAGSARAGQASYLDGEWTVVITRPLSPSDVSGSAQLAGQSIVPVGFVVWDGGNPGQRAVSMWVDVVFRRDTQ